MNGSEIEKEVHASLFAIAERHQKHPEVAIASLQYAAVAMKMLGIPLSDLITDIRQHYACIAQSLCLPTSGSQ